MISRRILTALFLLVAVTVQAAPKEPPAPPPPPMPQAQNLTLFRGRSVEIPLRAIGRAPSQLKFLIRTPPKFGRLGEIRFTSRKTAVVTYTHDEKTTAAYDSFTYAVQAVDTAVSAPGMVNIAISEEPPALSVVHTLDFGQLWVGESRMEAVTIRNTGGGSLAGRIIVPEPWRILDSAEYRLARKEEKKVRVLFAPSDSGEFVARLLFSHDPRSSVTLSGGARTPLEFEPTREVELAAGPGKTSRTGRFKIRNRTSADRTVEITVPDTIQAPEEIVVPADGEAEVTISTHPSFLGALEDRIDLLSDGYQRSLPLRVFAVSAIVRADPAVLDFGSVPLKSPNRKTLTLRNEGGASARLRVDAPPEVLIIPDPNTAVLAPGEKRTFEVELEVAGSGPWRKEITIAGQGVPPLSIPVSADGVSGNSSATPSRSSPSHPSAGPDIPSSLPPGAREDGVPESTVNTIPAIGKIITNGLSRSAMEFRWKKPAPNAVSTLIEYRILENSPSGVPRILWKKWQGASVREESGTTIALLSNLPPGRTWFLRIMSLDETGRRSRPSATIRLLTPPDPPVVWYWWVLGFLAAGAVAYGVVLVRRGREAEAAADAERLSRLGKP